jgi:hypothetical protein
MSVTARYTPVLPEGFTARFEHRRWVVLETIVTINGTDYTEWSQPMLMNRHEWVTLREHDATFTKTNILPNGGRTICRVYRESLSTDETSQPEPDELILLVEVECSWSDNYVKALGRNHTLDAAARHLKMLLAATETENTAPQGEGEFIREAIT